MLIGEYTHSIDDKNRLSLPAKFRAEMGKKVVLTPGLDGCLWVFTLKQWEDISGKLNESSVFQSDSRSINRYFLGGATEQEVDSLGRILVPDFLRDKANLKNKVVIIGVRNRAGNLERKSLVRVQESRGKAGGRTLRKAGAGRNDITYENYAKNNEKIRKFNAD